ncbi:MAG: response regulator transcription factor [Acidimicrobiales bacterium]|nr:response regulator transcription factor [Acidimicrobiales bacterium]MDG2218891.1 response regulator transcription factor [Acidimicrobiales bacterium]
MSATTNEQPTAADTETVIVIVEDDPNIADLVELYLRRDGFRPFQAGNGERALEVIAERQPKLILLDIGLPGDLDGLDVCRAVRATSNVPIIFLTARDDEVDRVLGLELGADDYVTKPFSPRELVARVKAILRRADGLPDPSTAPAIVDLGAGIVISGARREVTVNGDSVALAMREFDLAMYLAAHRGLALSRRQILDGVWGADWIGDDRTIDVHVRQLRKKLGDGLHLETVWGVGYRLD